MRICLMIEGQEGVTWDEWVALAAAVESAGLDGLFRSDHYTSFHGAPGGALDAWATIAALAPLTSRIRLGTLVSPATFRHPSELARVAVTADHASGGRVEVGVGAGWFEQEHRQNGFDFPATGRRLDRLAEYVEILLASWAAEPFDHDGTHFTLTGQLALPAPVQHPHPPVIFGGRGGPRSVALAARYGQEYNGAFLPAEECRRLRATLDEACRAVERDPLTLPLSLMTLVAPGRDRDDAELRLTRAVERFRGPRERCYAGSVDQMAATLGELEEAGVTRVFLQHPDRGDFDGLELLGDLARRVGPA
jgi:alkanesulfonate monooxygenase SsuD/methylene tetrahydromethanopterin reductase-like flavin-dependent oxidoreductase (luciferase family)